MINYQVSGCTMSLDEATTLALDDTHDTRDRSAVESEIARDAQLLANSLGRTVTVEAANGIELRRFAASPVG